MVIGVNIAFYDEFGLWKPCMEITSSTSGFRSFKYESYSFQKTKLNVKDINKSLFNGDGYQKRSRK